MPGSDDRAELCRRGRAEADEWVEIVVRPAETVDLGPFEANRTVGS